MTIEQKRVYPNPEYGLYNPYRGILVFGIDHDFENVEDYFRIIPMKVYAKKPSAPPADIYNKNNRRSPGGS